MDGGNVAGVQHHVGEETLIAAGERRGDQGRVETHRRT